MDTMLRSAWFILGLGPKDIDCFFATRLGILSTVRSLVERRLGKSFRVYGLGF